MPKDLPAIGHSVRPARPEEQGELSRLCVRATRHIGYDDVFIDRAMGSLTVPFQLIMAGDAFVAELEGGEVCGVVGVFPTMPGMAHLWGIFVDPPHWRRGIGRSLFKALTERVRDLKAGAIYIFAEPTAVPFYERMGAVRIGEAPFDPSPEIVTPVMLYVLPSIPDADGSG